MFADRAAELVDVRAHHPERIAQRAAGRAPAPELVGPSGKLVMMATSTLPALLLGGEVPADPDAAFAAWQRALRLPTVRGIIAARTLFYPSDDGGAAAVDTAVGLLQPKGDTAPPQPPPTPQSPEVQSPQRREV